MLTHIEALLLLGRLADACLQADVETLPADSPLLKRIDEIHAALVERCNLDPAQDRAPQLALRLNAASVRVLHDYALALPASELVWEVPDYQTMLGGFERKLAEDGPLDLDACLDIAAADPAWFDWMKERLGRKQHGAHNWP